MNNMWHIPIGEKQRYTFDTNACGIFAVLSAIESYKIEGLENLSDRYTSINIGGLRGNLPTLVVDSINEYGLLKEELLPFGGNNQIEYYSKNVITPSMISEAKKVLDRVEIKAEYVNFGLGKEYAVKEALKIAPLVGVFLNNDGTTHAMMIPNEVQVLDSYEPFIKKLDISRLHYAVKIIVKEKVVSKKREVYRPKNIALKEVVSKQILLDYGEKAWEFLDERLLKNLQFIREKLGKIIINNNANQYRGFDASKFRTNGTSQHNMGRGADFDIIGIKSEDVRQWIIEHQNELPEPNVWIEAGVPWVHMDVRYSDKLGVHVFKV